MLQMHNFNPIQVIGNSLIQKPVCVVIFLFTGNEIPLSTIDERCKTQPDTWQRFNTKCYKNTLNSKTAPKTNCSHDTQFQETFLLNYLFDDHFAKPLKIYKYSWMLQSICKPIIATTSSTERRN